jgi:hypothetical protein
VARLTLQLLPLSIRERMRMTPKVLTEARVGPSTSRRPLTFQVSANDDAGDGNGHCGVTNAKPNVTRLKSVIGHSVFGLGMYASGRLLAAYWPA